MKRILTVLLTMVLMIGLCGCGSNSSTMVEKDVPKDVYEDIQGVWYDKDSVLVYAFKGDDTFVMYGFGTNVTIGGTYEVVEDTITIHCDTQDDLVFTDVTVEDDVLSFYVPATGKDIKLEELDETTFNELCDTYNVK